MNLDELANAAGTDKGTTCRGGHAYTLVYEPILSPLREAPLKILELGLAIGGPEHGIRPDRMVGSPPSIEMWNAYFPNARLTGFDISDFAKFTHDRFDFVRGDCGVRDDLERLVDHGPFDIIIDDASHASFHQFLSMAVLMPALNKGGIYIVEDLQWQPDNYEQSLPAVPLFSSVVETFAKTGEIPNGLPTGVREAFDEVTFVQTYRTWELERQKRIGILSRAWRFFRIKVAGDPMKLAILRKG